MTDQTTSAPVSLGSVPCSVSATKPAGATAEDSPFAGVALAGGVAQIRKASDLGEVADSLIQVAPQLRSLFPRGGLERGATCSVRADLGAMSLLVNLLAYPLVQEKWISLIGFSDCAPLAFEEAVTGFDLGSGARLGFGSKSGMQMGARSGPGDMGPGDRSGLLRRLVMVPSPAKEAGEVVSAAIDSMDLVVVNSSTLQLNARMWSRITAKLRSSGATLVVLGAAQGQAEVECRVIEQRWFGLGWGQGRLRGQELQVRSRTKRDSRIRECVVEVGSRASYGSELAG